MKIRFKPVFDDCIADGVDNESDDATVVVIIGAIRREKKVTKKFNADNPFGKNNKYLNLKTFLKAVRTLKLLKI